MPSSALVTQLFSSLMRVYRSFPPVAPLIIATATGVHPGFTGCLTLELFNSGEVPIALYPGMAISQFFMHTVATDSDKIDRSALAGRRRPFLGTIELDEIAVKLASQL